MMPIKHERWDISRSGKGSDAKIIPVHLYEEEGVDQIYWLSQRQSAALLKISQYLEWKNRYDVLPTDLMDSDDFEAWNDQIKQRLMTPVEICAEIINCIQNDEDVMNELKAFINSNLEGYDGNTPGERISADSANKNLAAGTNPTCDNDILWAQATQIIQYTNSSIENFLQKFEEATNNIELMDAMASLPILDEIGVDALTKLAVIIQEALADGYFADYDEELELELINAVFCAAQMTCEISIAGVWDAIYTRAADDFTLPPDSWQTMLAFLLEVADLATDNTNIAIYMFFIYWGMIRTGNIVLPYNIGDRAFTVLLDLAVNDANDDWIYLADCVETQCDEPDSSRFNLIDGSFQSDGTYDAFIRSPSNTVGAKGEFNYSAPVFLQSWSLAVQALVSGSPGNDIIYVKLYLGETLAATLYDLVDTAAGGYTWQLRADGSTAHQNTEFDRVEIYHLHEQDNITELSDIWVRICFNPSEV